MHSHLQIADPVEWPAGLWSSHAVDVLRQTRHHMYGNGDASCTIMKCHSEHHGEEDYEQERCQDASLLGANGNINKKAVQPQGNRAMPQVFFSVEVRQQHSLQV